MSRTTVFGTGSTSKGQTSNGGWTSAQRVVENIPSKRKRDSVGMDHLGSQGQACATVLMRCSSTARYETCQGSGLYNGHCTSPSTDPARDTRMGARASAVTVDTLKQIQASAQRVVCLLEGSCHHYVAVLTSCCNAPALCFHKGQVPRGALTGLSVDGNVQHLDGSLQQEHKCYSNAKLRGCGSADASPCLGSAHDRCAAHATSTATQGQLCSQATGIVPSPPGTHCMSPIMQTLSWSDRFGNHRGQEEARTLSPMLRASDLDATYMLHDGVHHLTPPSLQLDELGSFSSDLQGQSTCASPEKQM